MKKVNNINWRLTQNEQRIIISFENEYGRTIVLTPNYNDVYEYAAMNNHLDWYEDRLVEGETITKYSSVTFYEVLNDDLLSKRLFKDYLNKVCKNNSAYKLAEQ